MSVEYLKNAKTIFWDFDGVIKDSVEVKSDAFAQLFSPFKASVCDRIRRHHESHSGVSRYEKIPIYLSWVGKKQSSSNIHLYSDKFSEIVKQAVINSPWVPGAKEFIEKYYDRKTFILVTATPQQEIEQIINALNIRYCFYRVYGAPSKKADSIKRSIVSFNIDPKKSVMIGDSISDYDSAKTNEIPFMLRRTSVNRELQAQLSCKMFDDFIYE